MDANTLTVFIVLLRTMERIVSIAFGGFAVYLGFQLFLRLPEQSNSEGKLILPGNISIFLTRVGPGAIFAAFGLVLVMVSFYIGMDISSNGQDVRIRGISQAIPTGTGSPLLDDRDDVRRLMFVLNNTLPDVIRDDLSQRQEAELEQELPSIKLRLMLAVWDKEEWGDPVLFAEWIPDSKFKDPPSKEAYNFFNFGKEGDQR